MPQYFAVLTGAHECHDKTSQALDDFRAHLLRNMASSESSVDEFLLHFRNVHQRVHGDVTRADDDDDDATGLEGLAHLPVFLPSCRPLFDDLHGGFHFKQCFDNYCWCVDELGDAHVGTVTSQANMLTCSPSGTQYFKELK